MKIAFADTSAVLAVLLDEAGGTALRRLFGRIDRLLASNLLEAEVRSVCSREQADEDKVSTALSHLEWVFPDRPLTREFRAVLSAGALRGADLWHVACALYVADDPVNLPFVTLDRMQAQVARALGFHVEGV